MLQSALNEGVGPALWVSPNIQLARQIVTEAAAVGIPATEDPRDPSFAAGKAICVVNAYKLFNGRSVFGVERSAIEIGSVVVDESHACVSTLSQQFRATFANKHPAYHAIIGIVAEDLKASDAPRFLEGNPGDPRSVMEVPFWSRDANNDAILAVLHEHREDDKFKYVYAPPKPPCCRHKKSKVAGFYAARSRTYPAATVAEFCTADGLDAPSRHHDVPKW